MALSAALASLASDLGRNDAPSGSDSSSEGSVPSGPRSEHPSDPGKGTVQTGSLAGPAPIATTVGSTAAAGLHQSASNPVVSGSEFAPLDLQEAYEAWLRDLRIRWLDARSPQNLRLDPKFDHVDRYRCLVCRNFLFSLAAPLLYLPERPRDAARVVPVALLNSPLSVSSRPSVLVKVPPGCLGERRYPFACTRCGLELGYLLTRRVENHVYLLPDTVTNTPALPDPTVDPRDRRRFSGLLGRQQAVLPAIPLPELDTAVSGASQPLHSHAVTRVLCSVHHCLRKAEDCVVVPGSADQRGMPLLQCRAARPCRSGALASQSDLESDMESGSQGESSQDTGEGPAPAARPALEPFHDPDSILYKFRPGWQ